MKFKKILALGIILFSVLVCFSFTNVYAEGDTQPEDTETITYPCQVKESLSKGGDVIFDITEGNVGDIVTAYVKADFLFAVSSVSVNGTALNITSDGKYTFELVEGENIFSVEFKVNNEKLTEIANLINGVKEDGFTSLFTVSNLLNLISWVLSTILSSGFFITLIKSKKLKSKTVDEVVDIVKNVLKLENAQALLDYLNNIITPVISKILEKIDGLDECMRVLCRCYVLAQDDTPENRLAIINELTKLNNNDEALSNQIRKIVKEEQKAQQEKIIARDKAIEELKENNANLVENKDSGDSYGQI